MSDQPIKRPRRQSSVTQGLRDLADQLTEVALFEANPLNWTGNDANGVTMKPNAMIDKALDMRIKCKINARTTVGLLKDLQQLINVRESGRNAQRLAANQTTAGDPQYVDQSAAAAEREAEAMIAKAQNVVRMKKQG